MERRHKELFKQRFSAAMDGKQLIVLDIPDDYPFGDEELIEILKERLAEYL